MYHYILLKKHYGYYIKIIGEELNNYFIMEGGG